MISWKFLSILGDYTGYLQVTSPTEPTGAARPRPDWQNCSSEEKLHQQTNNGF